MAYDAFGDGEVYIKTLKLQLPVEVSEEEWPELFVRDNHPRGSVQHWKTKADVARKAYADLRGFRLT